MRIVGVVTVLQLILLSGLCLAALPMPTSANTQELETDQSLDNSDSINTIIYPGPIEPDDTRLKYPVELLKLALSYSDIEYRVKFSESEMLQRRALTQLARGEGINVAGSMTSKDRERALLPIRIPIYKGLIGWRIPLINRNTPAIFEPIYNLRQLQGLVAGQVHDWPDTRILKENGLQVHGGSNYSGMFKMLSQNRMDYFPRSVVEIWGELESGKYEKLMVDPYVLIYYPTAYYFFVNKQDAILAKNIKDGLEAALKDGRFDQIFYEYHQEVLVRIDVKSRRVIKLTNPSLPQETPLSRHELWFSMPAMN